MIKQYGVAAGIIAALVAFFTVIASYVQLRLNNATELFAFPYTQWWTYLFSWWGIWNIQAWTKLLTAACFGLMPAILIIKLVGRRAGFFTEREGRSGRGI